MFYPKSIVKQLLHRVCHGSTLTLTALLAAHGLPSIAAMLVDPHGAATQVYTQSSSLPKFESVLS